MTGNCGKSPRSCEGEFTQSLYSSTHYDLVLSDKCKRCPIRIKQIKPRKGGGHR